MTNGSCPLVTMHIRVKIQEPGHRTDLDYDFSDSYPIEEETCESERESYYASQAEWLAGGFMYSWGFCPGSEADVWYKIVGKDTEYTHITIGG